ncbi:ArsR/SmtB family transcription factor [Zoogloea sp.]|jgi:DNA-binding transcriptional ArsR family regulator|uniref:ArsR/SmtB family transcription factor n=1 Tax=Zoogloea sp. TaxID=49181 RepID=UPI0035AF0468
METRTATAIFESLSSGWRLEAFRLLVRQGPEGMVAGDIASALDISPSSLSFHLKALAHAGLVSVAQEGRFQRYRANIPLMLDLIAYLTEECCSGQPEKCADLRAASCCPEAVLPPITATDGAPKP